MLSFGMMWCYVVSILTMYELYRATEPSPQVYIPKSQRRRTSRLAAQWGQLLKSWIKKGIQYLESTIKGWETRKKIRHRIACAKRSGLQRYPSPQVREHIQRRGGMKHAILICSAIAMSATAQGMSSSLRFDTDSGPLGIDSRCTACISHRTEDFIGVPQETNKVIKGVGGARLSNVMTGTILWRWEDDQGKVHSHRIPGSYYAPQANVRLLSPQHWMQSTMSAGEKRQDT